jgi:hypothetical protein
MTDAILDFPEKSADGRKLVQLKWDRDFITVVERWRAERNISSRQ